MTDSSAVEFIAAVLRNMPSPIAAEQFEPGFWRSCVSWEQIIEKVAPEINKALGGLTRKPSVQLTVAGMGNTLVFDDPADMRAARRFHGDNTVAEGGRWVGGWTPEETP